MKLRAVKIILIHNSRNFPPDRCRVFQTLKLHAIAEAVVSEHRSHASHVLCQHTARADWNQGNQNHWQCFREKLLWTIPLCHLPPSPTIKFVEWNSPTKKNVSIKFGHPQKLVFDFSNYWCLSLCGAAIKKVFTESASCAVSVGLVFEDLQLQFFHLSSQKRPRRLVHSLLLIY